MKYNPKIHHRKLFRLKGYDYAQAGLYFVTICCQNKVHLYGHVKNGEMILNEPGLMIEKWYYELENKFPDIKCREMIVMPNHFHCIVENIGIVPVSDVNAKLSLGEQLILDESSILDELSLGEHVGSLGERRFIGRTRRFAPIAGGAMV